MKKFSLPLSLSPSFLLQQINFSREKSKEQRLIKAAPHSLTFTCFSPIPLQKSLNLQPYFFSDFPLNLDTQREDKIKGTNRGRQTGRNLFFSPKPGLPLFSFSPSQESQKPLEEKGGETFKTTSVHSINSLCPAGHYHLLIFNHNREPHTHHTKPLSHPLLIQLIPQQPPASSLH